MHSRDKPALGAIFPNTNPTEGVILAPRNNQKDNLSKLIKKIFDSVKGE